MRKKSASSVHAPFRPSTYPEGTPRVFTRCGFVGRTEHPVGVKPCCAAQLSSSQVHVRAIEVSACRNSFSAADEEGLPGTERTAIEMDEMLAWIIPHPTVLQLQGSMTKLTRRNPRNIEVERLPLDMETVPRSSPTPFHQLRIVRRRPIAGNHMDLAGTMNRLLHKIHMLQHSHIHRGNFSRVMAPHDMIHLIQRRQVIVPCIITKADSLSFVCVHVEEGEFAVRKFGRARDRGTQQSATK